MNQEWTIKVAGSGDFILIRNGKATVVPCTEQGVLIMRRLLRERGREHHPKCGCDQCAREADDILTRRRKTDQQLVDEWLKDNKPTTTRPEPKVVLPESLLNVKVTL